MTDKPEEPTDAWVLRFFAKFTVGDGCWEWQASRYHDGYGLSFANGKNERAHRLSYRLFVGPIPAGLVLDHLCRNPRCIRPDHLEPVTNKENVARGRGLTVAFAARTHCARGHELIGANLYTKRGWRECRPCRAEASRRHQAGESNVAV